MRKLVNAGENGVTIHAMQSQSGFSGMNVAPSQKVRVAAGDGAFKFMWYSNGNGVAHKDSVQNNINNVVCARRVAHLDCDHALLLKIKHNGADRWALIEMGRVEESTPPLALAHTRDYANLRRALRSAGCAI